MNKIPLSEGRISGNLNTLEQCYKLNYMPQEVIEGKLYSDKIELAILLLEGEKEFAYRSLRFQQPAQLKSFIINCIRSYFLFAGYKKEITHDNFIYKENQFFKEIMKAFKQ
jgi:hypothetical protein